MNVQTTLQAAIAQNLTPAQQAELATLITELAISAKLYGMTLVEQDLKKLDGSIGRANAAWSALNAVGISTKY